MGNGFEHYCPQHILMLVLIAAAVTAGAVTIKHITERKAEYILRLLSVFIFAGETVQDILLVKDGRLLTDFLPLHLCNLGIFINLAASFARGKTRSYFSEISVVLILPGAAAALLFPTWNYRPFWSYLPLLCFFTHALLVFVTVAFLRLQYAHIRLSHYWYAPLFLTAVTPFIYLLDKKISQDYMFLLDPGGAPPLELLYGVTGQRFYMAGLAALVLLILAAEYAVYEAARKKSDF